MTLKRRRSPRGEGALLRDHIVDAAEKILLRVGNENDLSIRNVADAVGVTPPSIYLHFADKEQLLLAVCDRQFAQLQQALDASAAGATDPVHELWLRGKAYVKFGLEHPETYRIMFMGHLKAGIDPAEATMSPTFAGVIDAVSRAKAEGLLEESVDPMLVATMLWSNAHGVTSLLISKPDFPWPDKEQLIDQVLQQSLRGLAR